MQGFSFTRLTGKYIYNVQLMSQTYVSLMISAIISNGLYGQVSADTQLFHVVT